MSNRPDKCRWCGCAEIISDGFPAIDGGREVLFACGSVWYEAAMGWVRDPEQCGGQAGILQGNNPEIPEGSANLENEQ